VDSSLDSLKLILEPRKLRDGATSGNHSSSKHHLLLLLLLQLLLMVMLPLAVDG
jgi:hypothetical protein